MAPIVTDQDETLVNLLARFRLTATGDGLAVACECDLRVRDAEPGDDLLELVADCVQHWLTYHVGRKPTFKRKRR